MNRRTFDEGRREQGFKSQAHLDAFYRYYDHTKSCEECQQPGTGMLLEDNSIQPTQRRCAVAQELYAESDAQHFAQPDAPCSRGDATMIFLRTEYRGGNLVAVFDRGMEAFWYDGNGRPHSDHGIFCLDESNLRTRISNIETQNLDASIEHHALACLVAERGQKQGGEHGNRQ